VVILDVMALAGLFTLRLLAGGLAEGAPVFLHLQWISLFLFFSLALVKRTAEIRAYRRTGCEPSSRAYRRADMAPVAVVGTASGMAAVVFGAVFVAGPEARQLYDHPEVLWLAVPLAASWMLRLWLLAWRGEIDEDPVAFVAKDRVSYAVAVLALAVIGASL
jgi:4-hydroxybenzoate polyprenyltransferase